MRSEIRFLRRGRRMRLTDSAPTLTLLDYLRLTEQADGTEVMTVDTSAVMGAFKFVLAGASIEAAPTRKTRRVVIRETADATA